jgi:hypothetical protein
VLLSAALPGGFEDRIDGSDECSMNLPFLEGQFSGIRQDFIVLT